MVVSPASVGDEDGLIKRYRQAVEAQQSLMRSRQEP
jgi:hypothetical protein